MRTSAVLVAVVLLAVLSGQLFLSQPPEHRLQDSPAILEFSVTNSLRTEERVDPKGYRNVHVIEGDTVRVHAVVRDIDGLVVSLNLTGSDRVATYSGKPDRHGRIDLEVRLPEIGESISVRMPGAQPAKASVNVQPETVYILQPTGTVAFKDPQPWMSVDRTWVTAPAVLVMRDK